MEIICQSRITNILGENANFLLEVDVNSSIIFQLNQQDFLANEVNKSKFIRFLMGYLSGHGYVVGQSSNDADTLMGKHVLRSAKSGNPAVVVADDTLLFYLCTSTKWIQWKMSSFNQKPLDVV